MHQCIWLVLLNKVFRKFMKNMAHNGELKKSSSTYTDNTAQC